MRIKHIKSLATLPIFFLLIAVMAGCSNDISDIADTPDGNYVKMKVSQKPDFVTWSGNYVFGDTRKNNLSAEEDSQMSEYNGEDEVEINLSINDTHFADDSENKYGVEILMSKLSIHLRSASDLRIMLPLSSGYYCDRNDLYILRSHDIHRFIFGGETHQATYNFGPRKSPDAPMSPADNTDRLYTVTIKATYMPANIEEEGYILVETTGITEDVMAWCAENYGDGLNFNVYCYFNRAKADIEFENKVVNKDVLKTYLDKSTVGFTRIPDCYVNAIFELNKTNEEEGGDVNPYDCIVTPEESQLKDFEKAKTGSHRNGSSANIIYWKI